MDIGNEFDCALSLKFVMFGLLKFILFVSDGIKFHFLTIQIFWFKFSIWKWIKGER